jgi:RNA polymerase sigma factor (sigma-70 family)
MGSHLSDAEVVQRSVAQPAAFALRYERHLASVARFVARRVGPDLAEDLTAEVFARAFRGRAAYRAERDTALPWLMGIASNLVADHRRAERRRLATLERLSGFAPEITDVRAGALAPDLVRQLRRLPAADRDTLLLVAWGELSYEETAAALGVPIGTVRSRIARARLRLTDALGTETSRHETTIEGEARA